MVKLLGHFLIKDWCEKFEPIVGEGTIDFIPRCCCWRGCLLPLFFGSVYGNFCYHESYSLEKVNSGQFYIMALWSQVLKFTVSSPMETYLVYLGRWRIKLGQQHYTIFCESFRHTWVRTQRGLPVFGIGGFVDPSRKYHQLQWKQFIKIFCV